MPMHSAARQPPDEREGPAPVTSPGDRLPPPRRRLPAFVSAFNVAFPLGTLGAIIYFFFFTDYPFLKGFRFGQDMIWAGLVGGLWLPCWIIIARRRRRLR